MVLAMIEKIFSENSYFYHSFFNFPFGSSLDGAQHLLGINRQAQETKSLERRYDYVLLTPGLDDTRVQHKRPVVRWLLTVPSWVLLRCRN